MMGLLSGFLGKRPSGGETLAPMETPSIQAKGSEMTLSHFFDAKYYPHVRLYRKRPELDRYVFDLHIRPPSASTAFQIWTALHLRVGRLIMCRKGTRPRQSTSISS